MLDVLGLIVQVEGLSETTVVGINIGNFFTALVTFVLTALVLYFVVVVPYNRLSAIRTDEPEKAASAEDLLAEIRDLLRARTDRADQEPWCGGRSAISRSSSADQGRSATTG